MGNRLPYTPTSAIRSALRRLWLRSRERAAALKAADYTCSECGARQSKAKGREVKVEVHHVWGIEWEYLIEEIRKELLCQDANLIVLCEKCHERKTKE